MMRNLKCSGMIFLTAMMISVLSTGTAWATCSCAIGSGGSFIGMELTAQDCPPEDADDSTTYRYIDNAMYCMGGNVTLFSPWGDTQATPAFLESYFSSQGMRVFRNEEGTHFMVVHTNFKGKINGVQISSYAGGGVYLVPALDELCVSMSDEIVDEDGDGVPYCRDCDDFNNEIGGGIEDGDGDGVPKCYDCDDDDGTIGSGKGIDNDGDGYDQCEDCNDNNPYQNVRCETCPIGNPVDYYSGTMTHDIDLISLPGAPVSLEFSLHYNSQKDDEEVLGVGWTHNQAVHLIISENSIIIADQSRKPPTFATYDGGEAYYPSGATRGSLEKAADGYEYTRPDAEVLTFDTAGVLLERMDPHGLLTIYEYNESGQLISVTDPSDRSVTLEYYPAGTPVAGLVMMVQDPAGNLFRFEYSDRLLSSIVYPDADEDTENDPAMYLYYTNFTDEGITNGGDATNLTRLVDTRGNALSWSYDESDRAVMTTGPEGTKRLDLTYESSDTTVVLNSRSETTTYTYDDETKTLSITGAGCTSCSRTTVKKYNKAGKLIEKIDGEGNITLYEDFDTNGNAGTVIKAAGTDDEKVTYYTYDLTFNKITSEREPGAEGMGDRKAVFSYDGATGDLLSVARQGYSGGELLTLTTQYTYNDRGQPVLIDGPRSDVDDTVAFDYNPDTGYKTSMTQPLVGTILYEGYNPLGYPLTVTDPNGNETHYTYDYRGQVIRAVDANGGSTEYAYDTEGNLINITLPLGNIISYTYDHAGRLIEIADSQGNRIAYTYDTQGNRTREEIYDAGDTLRKYLDYTYDADNRLQQIIYPDSTYAEYEYDGNDNRKLFTDPGGRVTSYAYDAFNRLVQVTDAAEGVTGYAYDLNGNLASVIDANGNATTYRYDDFGRLLSELSPDTNKSLFTYDAAGNLVEKMDANGLGTTYEYDALNRLLAVHYPNSAQDIYYTYDDGTNGKGMLTGMQDASGTSTYIYTSLGKLAKEIKVISGVRYVTGYAYDLNGNLVSMTYPDGKTVTYTYNAYNQLEQVAASINNQSVALAGDITYAPFGGIESMNFGSGVGRSVAYDEQYRISEIDEGGLLSRQYQYDASGNIEQITDSLASEKSQSFVYDELSRLTQATGVYGTIDYGYDPVGNRITRTMGTETETYAYNEGTNWLSGITGSATKSYTYDNVGNVTKTDDTSLVYNAANRLIQIIENNALQSEYVYNGRGQRVKKKIQNDTIVYHYDQSGNIIAISDIYGNMKEKYVYMGGERIAKIDVTHEPLDVGDVDENNLVELVDANLVEQSLVGLVPLTESQLIQADVTLDDQVNAKDAMYIKQIVNDLRPMPPGPATEVLYYYQNDHLGTPLALTDQDGVKVWEVDYLPFGEVYQESGSEGQEFRFAGQYYDQETGLHYNWNRYYDPSLGRYLRADPIGTKGGMNLYSYANNSPIIFIDPNGLKSCNDCDECPCGKWSGKGQTYGGFLFVLGGYQTEITMECNCSDAKKKFSISCGRIGVGLGGDWSRQWAKVWGACNSSDIKWGGWEATGGDGYLIFGGSIGGSGGIDEGSFSWSAGVGLGANASLWGKCTVF